jgi:hypothetical protein
MGERARDAHTHAVVFVLLANDFCARLAVDASVVPKLIDDVDHQGEDNVRVAVEIACEKVDVFRRSAQIVSREEDAAFEHEILCSFRRREPIQEALERVEKKELIRRTAVSSSLRLKV